MWKNEFVEKKISILVIARCKFDEFIIEYFFHQISSNKKNLYVKKWKTKRQKFTAHFSNCCGGFIFSIRVWKIWSRARGGNKRERKRDEGSEVCSDAIIYIFSMFIKWKFVYSSGVWQWQHAHLMPLPIIMRIRVMISHDGILNDVIFKLQSVAFQHLKSS